MKNQEFFIDLYGYKNYNGEELTSDYLNNGEYIDCDQLLETKGRFSDFKKAVENYEKEWNIITEFFIKQRVLRDSPIFKHIMNWGKIKIELI